jgi:lipoprotein-releasing system permease protein
MIGGSGVLEIRKGADGKFHGRGPFLYTLPVKLTVIGMSPGDFDLNANNKAETNYWIVDDSRTKAWQYDENTVYVPFDQLQRDLSMDEQHWTRRDGTPVTQPARCTELEIKVTPGADLNATRNRVEDAVDAVYRQISARENKNGGYLMALSVPTVTTWEESQAVWLHAIEKEKSLVTALFSLISIVAIFLIFCIFYMIVVEKTRDIGIIKSVGATSGGVAVIFLGYGMAIGVVGSFLGLLVGYGIVHNINFIHEEMGKLLGIQIWDPQVYAFDTIPNTMNPNEVIVIMAVAIISSVLGALIPAIRAASMNPVEAVRFE